jgi:hypothetical protein
MVLWLTGAAVAVMLASMTATAGFLHRSGGAMFGQAAGDLASTWLSTPKQVTIQSGPPGSTFRPNPFVNLDPQTPCPEELRALIVPSALANVPETDAEPQPETLLAQFELAVKFSGCEAGFWLLPPTGTEQPRIAIVDPNHEIGNLGYLTYADVLALVENDQFTVGSIFATQQAKTSDDEFAPVAFNECPHKPTSGDCCDCCCFLAKCVIDWVNACMTSDAHKRVAVRDSAVAQASFNAFHREGKPEASKCEKCCADGCKCCCSKKEGQCAKCAEPCCMPENCCGEHAKCGDCGGQGCCSEQVPGNALQRFVIVVKEDPKFGVYGVAFDDDSQSQSYMVVHTYAVNGVLKRQANDMTCVSQLCGLICKMVEPESWREVGGQGCVEYFAPGHVLVIRQTPQVHEQIQKFFRQLSDAVTAQANCEDGDLKRCEATEPSDEFERVGVDFERNTPSPLPAPRVEEPTKRDSAKGTHVFVGDIIQLTKAKLSDDTIIAVIRATNSTYHLTGAEVIVLRQLGVSNRVLNYMIDTARRPENHPPEHAEPVQPMSLEQFQDFGTIEDAYRPAEERKHAPNEDVLTPVPEPTTPEALPNLDHPPQDGYIPGHEQICPYTGGSLMCPRQYYHAPRAYNPPADYPTQDLNIPLTGATTEVWVSNDLATWVAQWLFSWWPGQEGNIPPDTGADEDKNVDPSK